MKERVEAQKELISFLQEQGFIWGPTPEIYGGFSGFYTYGPLGKLLKNKIENIVRKTFQANGYFEVECPIVLPDIVWKASGHLETFKDKIIECEKCKAQFRIDNLLEERKESKESFSDQQALDFIQKNKIRCPSCNSGFRYEIKTMDLMMKTSIAGQSASLRPETATTTYLSFKRLNQFARKKLPFGVFQIGKAFRNEVSPRQHVLRGREFTQAEAQIFIDPRKKNNWPQFNKIKKEKLPLIPYNKKQLAKDQRPTATYHMLTLEQAVKNKYFQKKSFAWCVYLAYKVFTNMGIKEENIRIRQHNPNERAFYADDAWDIEIKLNTFGWIETCGIHDRTDYDLTQHEKFSNTNLTALDETGKKIKPHVLEIAFGIDRPLFALLDNAYKKKQKEQGKTMLNLPYNLAPIDLAVFPLTKDKKQVSKAKKIKEKLEKEFTVIYDESGSIGKRYLRNTTIGTPYCVTIDDKKGITLRDRNTGKQVRIETGEVNKLKKLLHQEIEFSKIGKAI